MIEYRRMVFEMPLGLTANRLVRPALVGGRARLVKSKQGKAWNTEARAVLRRRSDLFVMTGPIELEVQLYLDSIAGDTSNRVKALEDVLTGVCWHDDTQVTRLVVIKLLVESGSAPFMRVVVSPDEQVEDEVRERLAKSKRANGVRSTPKHRFPIHQGNTEALWKIVKPNTYRPRRSPWVRR